MPVEVLGYPRPVERASETGEGATRRARPIRWIALVVLVTVVGITAFVALWTPAAAPPPPRFASDTAPIAADVSTIAVPIDLPLATLEALAEAYLPRVLFELKEEKLDGDLEATVKVTRGGKLRLSSERGKLIAQLPVAVVARISAPPPRGLRGLRRGEPRTIEATAAVALRAAVALSIRRDWTLDLTPSLTYRWTSNPTIAVGGRKRDIAQLVDHVLTKHWPKVMALVTDMLREHDPLRPQLETIWTMLATRQRLRDTPPLWLVSAPEALYVGEPTIDDEAVHLTVGLSGRFAVVLGDPPPAAAPAPPLPARIDPPARPGIRLAVTAALEWEAMAALASANFVGKEQTIGDATLTLRSVTIYPSGDRIVVGFGYQAELAGFTTEGTLYGAGRLELDAAASEVRIADFDYLVETWDRAIAGVDELVHSGVREAASERLRFSFGEPLAQVRAQVTEGIAGVAERSGRIFHGSLDEITPRQLRITERAVVLDVVLGGSLALHPGPELPDLAALGLGGEGPGAAPGR